jgi:hypothetical protein
MKDKNIRLALSLLLLTAFGTARAASEHWTWNAHEYPYNATFLAVISIEGVEQRSEQMEIGAFCNDICRGSIKCVYETSRDRYYAFLTVNGEAGMVMDFRLWNHLSDAEMDVTCETTYTFNPNDFLGLPSNPYVFSFTLNFEGPVYIGEATSTWSDPDSWRANIFPTPDDEVYIFTDCNVDTDAEVASLIVADGQTLTILPDNTMNVTGELVSNAPEDLVLLNGAQLLNDSENVNATMEIDIFSYGRDGVGGWYTIASPMDEMAIEGSGFLTPDYDLYRYDGTNLDNEEWENYKGNVADFTIFENGRGYLYANSNTFSPVFTGTLNHASVTCPLTYNDRPNDELDGFNLIGNPFPHNIYKGTGGAIDDAHLASGYYTLTNEGTWQVHTFEEPIRPGQGFLVKTTAATYLTITKSNAAASAETGSKGKALTFTVSGATGTDHAIAYFTQGAGLKKLRHRSVTAPTISIKGKEGDYAIAYVKGDSRSLELLFDPRQPGEFTLSVSVDDAEFGYLHLIDTETGDETDLLATPTYTFKARPDERVDRFRLVFKVEESAD